MSCAPSPAPVGTHRSSTLGFVVAVMILAAACDQVGTSSSNEPSRFSANALEEFCVKDVVQLSEILSDPTVLGSNLSAVDCDRSSVGEDGFFETWHIFADETGTVTFNTQSEFDSLLKLYRVTASGDTFATSLLAENDDVAVDELDARVAASLRAGDNYLLRVAGFADEETGEYQVAVALTDSPPPPPETGSVAVSVTSTLGGSEAFVVTLNGAKRKPIVAGTPITYENMVAGDYTVALADLGDCTVEEPASQDISLGAEETAAVEVRVTCRPSEGTLRITTVTSGTDLDSGYRIFIDGERIADIGADEIVDIGLPVGTYEVSLDDVAPNCAVVSSALQSLDVGQGEVSTAIFAIECGETTQSPPELTSIDFELWAPNVCGIEFTSTYLYAVAYDDPDGGITREDTRVFVALESASGRFAAYESLPVNNVVGGDGFTGTIFLLNCLSFGELLWIDVLVMIEDPTGLESNVVMGRIDNPGGIF
jgi:hypothetical protein